MRCFFLLQVYIYHMIMNCIILSCLYHGFLLRAFVLMIFYNIFITQFRFLLLAGTS